MKYQSQRERNFFKQIVYGSIWKILSIVNKFSKHNDHIIMFYDRSPFLEADNNYVLYKYLVENKYNDRYKIIVVDTEYKTNRKEAPKNVIYTSASMGHLYFIKAKYVFYRANTLPIAFADDQVTVQLWHGSPFKGADKGQNRTDGWVNPYIKHFLSASECFNDLWSKVFSIPVNRIIVSGAPRLDLLKQNVIYGELRKYSKVILWVPTYRKRLNGTKEIQGSTIVPILKEEDYSTTNEYLKERNIKLIIKLHPQQSLENYTGVIYDNLELLSHAEFVKRKWNVYHLMAQCDAMITDYSNIFYDYMLLNRPIGFTEDDMDDYGSTRGFAVENPESIKAGMKIHNTEEFQKFIHDIHMGIDSFKEERENVNKLVNQYQGKSNCAKILDILDIR